MSERTKRREPFEKMCSECGTVFTGYGYSRCPECQRRRAAGKMAEKRLTHRKLLLDRNDELAKEGKRVCAKCYHVRKISEFRTSQPNRTGKINLICDKCLTSMYTSPARKSKGFDENFWRRKAYTVNTVGRARMAKIHHKKTSAFSLADLDWECKPQDLAMLCDRQNGKCKYCGVDLAPSNIQVDHIIPLSRFGRNHLDNLALACKDCNMLKGVKTEEEFLKFAREYARRFLVAETPDKEPGC